MNRPDNMPDDVWAGLLAWYNARPATIRAMIDKYPPTQHYMLRGQLCCLHSYEEDGTVTVQIPPSDVVVARCVFGVNPKNLIPVLG